MSQSPAAAAALKSFNALLITDERENSKGFPIISNLMKLERNEKSLQTVLKFLYEQRLFNALSKALF